MRLSPSGLSWVELSGWTMTGQNSDNRANSAQAQMNLPTRAELGKM